MPKPIKNYRCGLIVLSVWEHTIEREMESFNIHSFTIDKWNKDGVNWKCTKDFAVEDLPKISTLADAIYRDLRVVAEDLTKQSDEEYENS